ncbi:type IV secretory system conjugative DNA transfer family protein [Frankia sp. R82]|uniref:type IV secretory system conjugative DNA transfer family protein n=1 Tax=Frankia sp. R82 TaxID=2950553 RepID=UPI00204480F5|nr:type IV secretory system conjugative DNA transfer family protein [Frankia sp. R82]MCM3886824.1 type IV secretory system conjugative DNA transfer family protein [Frankia sp. R82]
MIWQGEQGSGTPPNPAVLIIFVVAFPIVAGVWAGAQVAALLFGAHVPMHVGLRAAVAALPRLAVNPEKPYLAWPVDEADVLPGATAYWIATALPLFGALLCAGGLVLLVQARVGVAYRRRMGLNPEARFAVPWQVAPMWVGRPVAGRMILGRIRRGPFSWLLATENASLPVDERVPQVLHPYVARRRGDRGAVLVIGPTRCGKTAALAVPAILEWEGPLIALSVKNDLLDATVRRRRVLGEVRVFDPTGITGERSATWSPLAEAVDMAGARLAARSIANSTDWTSSGSEMSFWTAAGEDLLGLLFWLASTAGLGMEAVVGWTTSMDRDAMMRFAQAFARHDDPVIRADGEQVLAGLAAVWKTDPKQISSVFLVARQMIRPWQEPSVRRSADGSEIDLDWLLDDEPAPLVDPFGDDDPFDDDVLEELSDADPSVGQPSRAESSGVGPHGVVPYDGALFDHELGGDPAEGRGARRRRSNSVYLCADLDGAERLAPVLGGLVDDLIRAVYARVGATGRPLDPPLLVVIDEAGNWPMKNLPGRISTCAGMGIQLMLVYQSKAQIDAAYGAKADVIVSNATTKVFFSGLSDKSTLDYAASLLGQEHVAARSVSSDAAPGGGRQGVSDAPTRLELLPAHLLRQVAPGQALLLHHTLPPVHLYGRYWFRDPVLRALANGEPPPEAQPGSVERPSVEGWLLREMRAVWHRWRERYGIGA